ncbi:hypothetical protein RZS08_12135, partial [Arthrospira platensis SPKY1]|nr:hypothetical protein [Arthrospira platensis SPKY1]
MKITSLHCYPLELPLAEPYTIFYETVDRSANVILRMETDTGLTGWGCAAPDLPVTGETVETVMSDFQQFIEPILRGTNPIHYIRVYETLKTLIPNS